MLFSTVRKYLDAPEIQRESYLLSSTPFFLFVSDEKYQAAKSELAFAGVECVRLSVFCNNDDKVPSIDDLLNYINKSVGNAKKKKYAIIGLGEFLALLGSAEALHTILRLKDYNFKGVKVVFLLRGLASLVSKLLTDLRFDSRRYSVIDDAKCDLSFYFVKPSVGLSALASFKAMLEELENGKKGRVVVNTTVSLDLAIFTVSHVNTAFDAIKLVTDGFNLEQSCGSDEQWTELLSNLNENNYSIDEVFEKFDFNSNLESDFYSRIAGRNYPNWLYFISLKCKEETLQSGYLRYVLNQTTTFDDFSKRVLEEIIYIKPTDARFPQFYEERKVLTEKFPEPAIADFVISNRQAVSESIFKLTDRTEVEREEVIAWLSVNGMITQLERVYPALAAYMGDYIFKCPILADLLTKYFRAYKRQKLLNMLEKDFLEKVEELALPPRMFNHLPTRNEVLDKVDQKGTYLYWLDALGVEYLGLIETLAQKYNLLIQICIARAELPTITEINKDFFDEWKGDKEKNNDLDNIKHKDTGGYNFTNNELPIHLAKELEIITEMMNKAATKLAQREIKRFLIVSDHGASRLAVLRRKEEKYNTDTKGEHSGRCCKSFQPDDELPFAAEENGYLVLADYGRFRGSRAANVEVHGGASLEEVVVPIIELTLKDANIVVKLVEETVSVDIQKGAVINLYVNWAMHDISIVIRKKRYMASRIDSNHFTVKLPDIKRAGDYSCSVYAGDNLIGDINFKAHGKSAKVNDDFNDLF